MVRVLKANKAMDKPPESPRRTIDAPGGEERFMKVSPRSSSGGKKESSPSISSSSNGGDDGFVKVTPLQSPVSSPPSTPKSKKSPKSSSKIKSPGGSSKRRSSKKKVDDGFMKVSAIVDAGAGFDPSSPPSTPSSNSKKTSTSTNRSPKKTPKKKKKSPESSSKRRKSNKKVGAETVDDDNGFVKVALTTDDTPFVTPKYSKKNAVVYNNNEDSDIDSNEDENERKGAPPPPPPMMMEDDDDSQEAISGGGGGGGGDGGSSDPVQFHRRASNIIGSPAKPLRPKISRNTYNDVYKLKPVDLTENEPMDPITLMIRQPNLKPLKIADVDPANTTVRMIREFLHEYYYKGNDVPRSEQRALLYNQRPIFDATGDPDIDDAKTLADHGLTQNPSQIELEFMHVHVIDPSTKQSMTIDNVDPMNDCLLEMRKLALKDGYNIEKLRVLHKEADYAEIGQDKDDMTFFDCGVKHEHTLMLEWPKIKLLIRIPRQRIPKDHESSDDNSNDEDKPKLWTDRNDPSGRPFQVHKQFVQAELCRVENIHKFVYMQTGIRGELQHLFFQKNNTTKGDQIFLDDPTKVLADYDGMDNGIIIQVKPITLKVNYRDGGGSGKGKIKSATKYYNMYPNDTIDFIKGRIASGGNGGTAVKGGGIPAIPKRNQILFHHGHKLTSIQQRIFQSKIVDGDEVDVEKAK